MHPFPQLVALVVLLACAVACVIGLCVAFRIAMDAPYWDTRQKVGMYIASLLCGGAAVACAWAIVFIAGVKP